MPYFSLFAKIAAYFTSALTSFQQRAEKTVEDHFLFSKPDFPACNLEVWLLVFGLLASVGVCLLFLGYYVALGTP
jgi:hypothetical protein